MSEKSNSLGLSSSYLEELEAFNGDLFVKSSEAFPHIFNQKLKKLENSILKTSNQYVFEENTSSWGTPWFEEAYLAYFLFTQASRLFYTFHRIKPSLDLDQKFSFVDFGSGPSTARLAAHAVFKNKITGDWLNIDSSHQALAYGKKLEQSFGLNSLFQETDVIPLPKSSKDFLILSFSNCEGLNLENALKYSSILILEPGQQSFSKKLIGFRKLALKNNFKALAPCPHQNKCPMTEGKKSWCHDTAPKPKFLSKYDLPFSTNRLNFSYLFLQKDELAQTKDGLTRVIGDVRPEKGKTKVSICRGDQPEFLSWLKKSKLDFQLNRGDLIELPTAVLNKGQEVRIEDEVKIKT